MILADNNKPTISVIIPIYNVEQYLNQCIESVVTQDYRNLEIILVDDGSKDKCPEMCDHWAEQDERIIVIHKPNGGLSDARNAGLRKACGQYISFIDSDDWVDSSFLQRLYDSIITNNSDIAECSVELFDESGTLRIREAHAENTVIDKISALRHLISENGIYQTVWNKLYKTEAIDNLYFEVGKYHEDEYWTYKVLDRINKISIVSEALYYYRQRQNSIMGMKYTKSRLDGLHAKYERLLYLSKYNELKNLCSSQLIMECLWNLQAILRNFEGDELKAMEGEVLSIVAKISDTAPDETESFKNRFWVYLFKKKPLFTAAVRNKLRIGL